MKIPENLKFTREHEWVRIEGEMAVIGITDFAQGELGDVVFVEIETEGETLEKGEIFGTVEAVKTVSDLFMPLTGEVVEINEALAARPELVNQDPYGEGWMIRIKVAEEGDVAELLTPEEYRQMVEA